MSTNFYIRRYEENTNQQEAWVSEEHIGKRSGGWTFTFNGQKQKSVADWRARIASMIDGERIQDEYYNVYTADEFWAAVDRTLEPWGSMTAKTAHGFRNDDRNWTDGRYGFSNYDFC